MTHYATQSPRGEAQLYLPYVTRRVPRSVHAKFHADWTKTVSGRGIYTDRQTDRQSCFNNIDLNNTSAYIRCAHSNTSTRSLHYLGPRARILGRFAPSGFVLRIRILSHSPPLCFALCARIFGRFPPSGFVFALASTIPLCARLQRYTIISL